MTELNADDLRKFLKAIYNSYVAKIEVEREVEALSIFERTNARGLDLEISGLLKNYLFARKVARKNCHKIYEDIITITKIT